ncbi:TetR family transcriptional regulator [Blastococcus sp. SYSU D00820]
MTETARQAQRLATWRGIQATAIRLVGERGFAAVTVDDVAAAAGTSRRTFFNYFPTKAAALFDPDPELAGHLQELIGRAPVTGDPWADLRWICTSFVAAGQDDVLAVRRRLVAEFPELGEYQASVHRHVETALAGWARQRLPGDPLTARLLASVAAAALGAAFATWDPATAPAEFVRLADRALTLARVECPVHVDR